MKKTNLLTIINNMTENQEITFIENLDSNQKNYRTMVCSKEHLIELINNYFNDDLYGHVKDNVMTTIIDYEINDIN